MIRGGAVDGVIIGGRLGEALFQELQKVSCPVVLIHDFVEGYDSVTVDNVNGAPTQQ